MIENPKFGFSFAGRKKRGNCVESTVGVERCAKRKCRSMRPFDNAV